jgi:hypothetical protein
MTLSSVSCVLRAHTMTSPGDHWACLCGRCFHVLSDWSDHVAAEVLASP